MEFYFSFKIATIKSFELKISIGLSFGPSDFLVRRSQQLGLSVSTTLHILRKGLGLHPYKIVLAQEFNPLDHRKRREFCLRTTSK